MVCSDEPEHCRMRIGILLKPVQSEGSAWNVLFPSGQVNPIGEFVPVTSKMQMTK
jgi:hypothetical protein